MPRHPGLMVFSPTWDPDGLISTRLPSPALTASKSPLGAVARPSGAFRSPPVETGSPSPPEWARNTAKGMEVMRLSIVSATRACRCG